MIQSIYTHIFQRKGHCYLYNAMHRFFAEISEDLFQVLYDRDYESLPSEVLDDLLSKNVLVPHDDKYQYYNESLIKSNIRGYNLSQLSLVLVPTTACNFDCPYCFEGQKIGKFMSDETQLQLVEFIKKRETVKNISLTWYGGEPLLAFQRVQKLYNAIREIDGVEINGHSILTNGYLINREIIDFMCETGLKSIQITLDGVKENHNLTRCLKGSREGTYENIIRNIGEILTNLPDCDLSIRINISKRNKRDYISMHKELRRLYPDKTFAIYPGIIREETPDGCSMCYSCLNPADYFEFLKECHQEGISVDFMPRKIEGKGCIIHSLNAFIIGPEGEIYTCWNDVNHPDRVVGNIRTNDFNNRRLFMHYLLETSPFSDKNCKDCVVFPACSGGCGYYRSKNLVQKGHYSLCPFFKDTKMLEESLLLYLESKKNNIQKFYLSI